MASKVKKWHTYVVIHSRRVGTSCNITMGWYKVGARNEKEAEQLVRLEPEVGKTAKLRVRKTQSNLMPYGIIAKQ